jgi:hypothetical protein
MKQYHHPLYMNDPLLSMRTEIGLHTIENSKKGKAIPVEGRRGQ